MYRELPFPSSCCKGEACLPRSHYRGKPRVQNCVSRAPVSKLVLQRGSLPSDIALPGETSDPELCIESSRFQASVAKGKPAFRYRITGGNLESRIEYQGVGADFEKPKKYFQLIMNKVA